MTPSNPSISCKNFKKSLADKTMILTENFKSYESEKNNNSKQIDFSQIPYEEAILNLRKITKLKSPIHKLKNILKTAVLIIECIKKFYLQFERNFSEEINSDEIMSILIYVCCKAEVKELYTHCSLIESFITNQLSSSVAGYYLITLKASLEYIASDKMVEKKSKLSFNV